MHGTEIAPDGDSPESEDYGQVVLVRRLQDGLERINPSIPVKAANLKTKADDPEMAEYMVRVDWIKTVPVNEAIKEKGFFGNQNIVAKPRVKKWPHTVERLKARFGISD